MNQVNSKCPKCHKMALRWRIMSRNGPSFQVCEECGFNNDINKEFTEYPDFTSSQKIPANFKPDDVVAKGCDSKFKVHPEGQFLAQLVDVVDMGERVEKFQDYDPKVSEKCVFVFRTGETNESGQLIDVDREFTVSMGDKANLRKALEQWRGKKYTNEEIGDGVGIGKLCGNWALITVEHKSSQSGNTYAVINSIVGVPKVMEANKPKFPPYLRAGYYDERKKVYAEEVKKFLSDQKN